MEINLNDMVSDAINLDAVHAGIITTDKIKFSSEFRALCEQNKCGKYGTNWMCPPAVGPLCELEEEVMKFKYGLVIQTVYYLADSFDFEGMEEAKKVHSKIYRNILEHIKNKYALDSLLPLDAGNCELCSKCTYPEGKPCRFPERAIPSIESYGINAGSLAESCDFPYINGADTVSYMGLILFNLD